MMPLPRLLDFVYTVHTENMDEEQREEFDADIYPEVRSSREERARAARKMAAYALGMGAVKDQKKVVNPDD